MSQTPEFTLGDEFAKVLTETTMSLVCVLDQDGRILFFNDACERVTGFTRDEVIGGDARDFVDKYGLTYPMLRDGPGDVRDEYGILGLPETFVVDRRGRIAAVARGPVDERFMREQVAPLLQERT